MIELTVVTPCIREAFYETLLEFWDQRWEPSFLQQFLDWRYARRPNGETLVAMSGGKCLGLIDTFIRPYRVGSEDVLVREPCDWFCRPVYRGVGMRMMRFINQRGELLQWVGLPETAIAISRRMNWARLTEAQDFGLRLTLRQVVAAAVRFRQGPPTSPFCAGTTP